MAARVSLALSSASVSTAAPCTPAAWPGRPVASRHSTYSAGQSLAMRTSAPAFSLARQRHLRSCCRRGALPWRRESSVFSSMRLWLVVHSSPACCEASEPGPWASPSSCSLAARVATSPPRLVARCPTARPRASAVTRPGSAQAVTTPRRCPQRPVCWSSRALPPLQGPG